VTDQLRTEMEERAALFRVLADRFGCEVLKAVAEHTARQVEVRLQRADLPRRNLDAVMELLWNQMDEGMAFDVIERSSERLELRVTKCVFAEMMRSLDAQDIGNAFYCAYDEGFCRGLNPAIRFTRTQTLMAGDSCCDHTYELKGG